MKSETLNPYNDLPEENKLISHYQPKFLARGGDHLVYEIAGHDDVVLKVSSHKIKDILSANQEITEEIEKKITVENNQIAVLRNFFGNDHTIAERRFLMKVPISKELIDEIFLNDWQGRQPPTDKQIDEVWTSVVVQKKVPQILSRDHISLNFRDATDDRPDIIQMAQSDISFKNALQDFTLQAIRYANKTGNILAIAGEDNIILYKKEDGTWNYLLVDAIPMFQEPVFLTAKNLLKKKKDGLLINKYEERLLIKAQNFVIAINGLASKLDIVDRLTLD